MENLLHVEQHRQPDKDKYSDHSNTDPQSQKDCSNSSCSSANLRCEETTPVAILEAEFDWASLTMEMANSCSPQSPKEGMKSTTLA